MDRQMIAILALALLALFAALVVLEMLEHDSAAEAVTNSGAVNRLKNLYPVFERVGDESLPGVLDIVSSCHAGYTITAQPFQQGRSTHETTRLRALIAQELALDLDRLRVGEARLTRADFSYGKCSHSEIDLPVEAMVISLRLASGGWLNAEVHAHEWHWREKMGWMARASGAFLFVGGISIFFMRRLSQPLSRLTDAAQRFGAGLQVSEVKESGTIDLRRAIRSFNQMQRQVTDEIARRMSTLAAISHDVRTPLTALRVKAELVDNADMRRDLITSIDRMEQITASALEFLKGEARNEPMRCVDLSALLESECQDFEEVGRNAKFVGAHDIHHVCRPDALARAVRNLIDNAIKYGNGARVELRASGGIVDIAVTDTGPGIPADKVELAVQPFERLSKARESNQSGFGLGLAVAKAIAQGHEGELILAANEPTGLVATIRLPIAGI
jgi:signal transduction histidine kinase